MRIWDIEPKYLSRNHLLGEHLELHAIWIILTTDKGGSYRNHPEVLRWKGNLDSLYFRHQDLVKEFMNRGYGHHSPLNYFLETSEYKQDKFINTIEEQKQILLKKDYEFYKQWGWE